MKQHYRKPFRLWKPNGTTTGSCLHRRLTDVSLHCGLIAPPAASQAFVPGDVSEHQDPFGLGAPDQDNLLPKAIPHNYQSPVTWRARKSIGLCPLFSRAASAPGVATSWPRSNSGFRSVGCMAISCFWIWIFASQAPPSDRYLEEISETSKGGGLDTEFNRTARVARIGRPVRRNS
jgi:hypothetical protein